MREAGGGGGGARGGRGAYLISTAYLHFLFEHYFPPLIVFEKNYCRMQFWMTVIKNRIYINVPHLP